MRADIVPGASCRKLSDLQGPDPLVVVLSRGWSEALGQQDDG